MTVAGPPAPARAYGAPLTDARIRVQPEDFVVEERLGFDPAGDGEHDFLRIRKTGTNTAWLARQLAKHAGIPARDVGYAGLKDRHAVTTQFFTVRRPSGAGTPWDRFAADGVELLSVARHDRKLRRGAHRSNAFRLFVHGDFAAHQAELETCLKAITAGGIPNYFGAQRFGRDNGNLHLAESLFGGRRLPRERRGMALSAARALLFNAILDTRVRAGSWNRILAGEQVNLDGSGSVFAADDEDLAARAAALDVHPTGALWGRGAPLATGAVAAIERDAVSAWAEFVTGLEAAGVDAAVRPLRARVSDLRWSIEDAGLRLEFELPKGSFATALLGEIAAIEDAQSA